MHMKNEDNNRTESVSRPDTVEFENDTKRSAQKHNRGVCCDVRNCTYHDGECYCSAERIAIGPSFACSCTDTVCATFRSK